MDNLEQAFRLAGDRDDGDPLADFSSRFWGLDDTLIYLDGNSLGPLPLEARELAVSCLSEEWGRDLIQSWNKEWFALPERLGDLLAPVIGANAGEVCFADSVTVNLFKLAGGALALQPERTEVLTDDLNFPSDFYALEGLPSVSKGNVRLRRVPSKDGIGLSADTLCKAIDEKTALVTVSHVTFKSGYRHDLERICSRAREVGAVVLADLSHSVGAVPIELDRWGVDLAVGCTYKYLNGGPGAPAFLYVRNELQEVLPVVLPGWFGAASPFAFTPQFTPARGIRRFLVGTPPVLSMRAVEPGIRLIREAGTGALWGKSRQLTEDFLELFDAHLLNRGFGLGSPRNAEQRGSHLSLKHREAYRINRAMIEPYGNELRIIPDFREPDNLRLGFAPLFLKYRDVVRTVQRLMEIIDTHEFERFDHEIPAVT